MSHCSMYTRIVPLPILRQHFDAIVSHFASVCAPFCKFHNCPTLCTLHGGSLCQFYDFPKFWCNYVPFCTLFERWVPNFMTAMSLWCNYLPGINFASVCVPCAHSLYFARIVPLPILRLPKISLMSRASRISSPSLLTDCVSLVSTCNCRGPYV